MAKSGEVDVESGEDSRSKNPIKPSSAEPRKPKQLKFPCQTFTQGSHTLAFFTCPAKQLYEIVEVNQRAEDKDIGYQRVLSQNRVSKIANFVSSGGTIPLSVLISFDHGRISGEQVIIENRPDAGWVIDGQHRVVGASKAELDLQIPVIAFFKLDEDEQINFFVTINKEQKGVPTALYLDLLKHLPGTRQEKELREQRGVDLADLCKTNEDSPFFNRIVVTTSPRKGQLSITNWVRKVSPLLEPTKGMLAIHADDVKGKIIDNLYKSLQIVFPDEFDSDDSIFFQTLGFGAILNCLPTIWHLCLAAHKNFKLPSVTKLLRGVDDFDFSVWHKTGTGNQAESFAAEQFRNALMESSKAKSRTTSEQFDELV